MERRKLIALMVPGESFSQKWLIHWTRILCELPGCGFDLAPVWCYTSNPAHTRAAMVQEIRTFGSEQQIDYVCSIDDDNLVTPDQILRLVGHVDRHPDSLVAGWTWIDKDDGPEVSNGMLTPNRTNIPTSPRELKGKDLLPRDYTGFPFVLCKPGLLNIARFPFMPLPNEHSNCGVNGEDTSFCIRLAEAGYRVLVDPSCYVPHLKTREVPGPVEELEPVNLMEVA